MIRTRDYFVDGLPEELTAVLAQVPDLRVIARTSAFAFRGRDADVRLIGRKLNVQTVVEGSVRWSGSRLRVTVQMADCGDGCHLFAESFDVEEKELFTLQSEMAQMISDVLVPHLPERGDSPILRTPQPVQPEVYRLYLRGRYHWNRRRRADLEKAIGYCESAIAIQPDYAPAYTCIADACWVLCFDMLAPYRDVMLKAKAAAARALELDPGLAEAHVAFAAVAGVFEYLFGLAEVHVRRAIELKPSYAPAHYIHACLPALRGQTEEALAEMKTSLGLDPLSIMVNRAMVACLCEMRQFDRAVAQAKETIEFDPSFYGSYLYLGWAYMAAGKYPLALEALEQARSLGGEDRVMLGYLAASKAKLGKKDEAELILLRLLDPAPSAYVPPLVVAAAFVALEKIETAFDFLERAVEERNGSIMHLRQDPFFQPLHGMPRFDDLCRRMNLV